MKLKNKDILQQAFISLSVNLVYALYNGVLGVIFKSRWFICVCAYYVILSVLRFSAVNFKLSSRKSDTDYFITKFSGVMFILLSLILSVSVFYTLKYEIGTKYHEIVMITIATYTFTKITIAVVNYIKSRKHNSPFLITLRSISFADGGVSIFSLQRSMLTSFGEMSIENIQTFNLLTGTGVCLLVIILGIIMIKYERK